MRLLERPSGTSHLVPFRRFIELAEEGVAVERVLLLPEQGPTDSGETHGGMSG
jgi:hypothetical protein